MRRQLAVIAQRLSTVPWQQGVPAQCTCSFSVSALAAQAPQTDVCDVPAGHENSDLRNSISNISLNRRRDISLRSDIKLWKQDEECLDLRALLRGKDFAEGKITVLFGVPDMGKVCTETHVPGFTKQADRLRELGVSQILALAVAPPSKVRDWATGCGLNTGKVEAMSDKTGAFARLLGVEINKPEDSPPHCHRYAAIVEHGILLKLKVENENAKVGISGADNIVKILEDAASRTESAKGKK